MENLQFWIKKLKKFGKNKKIANIRFCGGKITDFDKKFPKPTRSPTLEPHLVPTSSPIQLIL